MVIEDTGLTHEAQILWSGRVPAHHRSNYGEAISWIRQSLLSIGDPMNEDWRYTHLHPDYEMKEAPEHKLGIFPVHRLTGAVCDCTMQWNDDGTVLSCPVCGLDGT